MHATVCDMITDLVQNALEAGAGRVVLEVDTRGGRVSVRVSDDGKGMDAETLGRVSDPFFSEPGKHAGRRAGLGIPLMLQTASACGGGARIESAPGRGTEVSFRLDAGHVDTPPLGDLPGTALGLMAFPGDYELELTRRAPGGGYSVSRRELAAALGGLAGPGELVLARDFLRSQEAALAGPGALPAGPAGPGRCRGCGMDRVGAGAAPAGKDGEE